MKKINHKHYSNIAYSIIFVITSIFLVLITSKILQLIGEPLVLSERTSETTKQIVTLIFQAISPFLAIFSVIASPFIMNIVAPKVLSMDHYRETFILINTTIIYFLIYLALPYILQSGALGAPI
ncbi:MAG: hypothetical protein QM532_01245 [Cyanobium sp. MAG06]|nr:hypothetical protein [Cyanobium sp. MAG06]